MTEVNKSSYNLGISVRHGKEFFDWLIKKEQEFIPSMVNTYALKISQGSSTSTRFGRDQ